jgi:hypothetical protein
MQPVKNGRCVLALANPAEHWICFELLVPPLRETKGGKHTKEGQPKIMKQFNQ